MEGCTMKTLIFIFSLYLLLSVVNVFPQGCTGPSGTKEEHWIYYDEFVGFVNEDDLSPYNPAIGPTYEMGLALHIITDSQGNQGISEQELQLKLQELHSAFTSVGFNFIIFSQEEIANDNYLQTTLAEENQLAAEYNIPDVINIYFRVMTRTALLNRAKSSHDAEKQVCKKCETF